MPTSLLSFASVVRKLHEYTLSLMVRKLHEYTLPLMQGGGAALIVFPPRSLPSGNAATVRVLQVLLCIAELPTTDVIPVVAPPCRRELAKPSLLCVARSIAADLAASAAHVTSRV